MSRKTDGKNQRDALAPLGKAPSSRDVSRSGLKRVKDVGVKRPDSPEGRSDALTKKRSAPLTLEAAEESVGVSFALPKWLVDEIDALRAKYGVSRAEALRRYIEFAHDAQKTADETTK